MGGIDITGPGNKIIKLADPMRNQYVTFTEEVSLIIDEHWISDPKPKPRPKLRLEVAIRFPASLSSLYLRLVTNACLYGNVTSKEMIEALLYA
jgi:hypothetical protein